MAQVPPSSSHTAVDLTVIYTIVCLDLIGVALIQPLISALYKILELDPITYGVVGSVYGFMQFVFAPIMGHISDTHGRRLVLFISFCGSAISYFTLGFAATVGTLIISRAIVGVVKQTLTIAEACITDTVAAKELLPAFSRYLWLHFVI